MTTKRREFVPLLVTFLILAGLPAVTLGYEYLLRPALGHGRAITVRASVPQEGGFAPDVIRVRTGERVTLRFRSQDVTHGVAIGPGLGIDLGHVDPGQTAEVTLTFDRPGTYTYYCNSWCSDDHWRMLGVIEVVDPARPEAVPTPQRDPVIEALIVEGVDIDAPHELDADAGDEHGGLAPVASRGVFLIGALTLSSEVREATWQRAHTPEQAVELLADANPGVLHDDLVDVVAYLWLEGIDSAALDALATLYQRNCAACHGETGGGDGPAADLTIEQPVAFSDAAHMFTRRGDVLYAKIRRGGMGTDMPNFGTLFTPEETWGLVEYLWTLAFVQDGPP